MNKYNNTFGYHTPKLSEKIFNRINNNTDLEFIDTSWHNDVCDSIEYHTIEGEEFIKIMFPNSIIDDPENEEYNSFWISDHDSYEILSTYDILEVIDFVNNLKINNKI